MDKNKSMIEFFSGIGGMRVAAHHNKLDVKRAYDISLYANAVYQHNFGDAPFTKLVEQLKADDIIADMWTMSPPCQPFTTTRGAKGRDIDDKRCNGLKALLERLSEMTDKPSHILLENVQPFRHSRMREAVLSTLKANGYGWKEYLLSPIQIGIPNHRLRYYLLAELHSTRWTQETGQEAIETELPKKGPYQQHCVGDYLVDDGDYDWVPPEILAQPWAKDLGVVRPSDIQTHCFTAGYSRIYHRSTGSLLLVDDIEESVEKTGLDRSNMTQYRLRRFLPSELLRIFGFPDDFSFPDSISLEQQYRLIGNSVNVKVIEHLLDELLTPTS